MTISGAYGALKMNSVNFQHTLKNGWKGIDDAASLDSPNTLVLAFCSPKYIDHPEVLSYLTKKFPHSIITGCSGSGEILNSHIHDDSIAAIAIKFTHSTIKLVHKDLQSGVDSKVMGLELAKMLNAPQLKGALILSEGLKTNGSHLIEGFNSGIDSLKVVVSGGLAGDGSDFKKTWVLYNGIAETNKVVAIGMFGDKLQFGHGSQGGWDIFGSERLITKSKDNVLFEIDNQPALKLYKEYLGERASDLPASGLLFPLQIRQNQESKFRLVRTILAVNEADQSLTFAGNMPEGYLAQLMRANFDRVIDGAAEAATMAKKCVRSDAQISCVIAVSCVGRRLVLGERAEEEIEALAESFGKNTSIIGFYSYGELSPDIKGSPCELHNQSMTLFTISEAV